jgi:tetratricopeptide (TPR) repeat protein
VLNWFTRRAGKWLIIFDGADHLHKRDQNFVDPSRYIPSCLNVHVIITSRSSTAGKLSTFEGVNVGQLEEAQAVDLFFRCAEIPRTVEKTEAEVKVIVKELGCLALAITIAGTYVSQTPRLSLNLLAYLEDYRQRRQELLDEQPDELIHEYGHSVMTVWETSYSAVYDQLPEACWVLTLLAFINYKDIFLDLFSLESHSSTIPIRESWTSIISAQGNVNIHSFEKCFAILERYSLLHRQRNKSLYSMHRLVHAWGQDRLLQKNRQDIKRFCLAALQLLFEAVLNCIDLPKVKLRLMPHLRENFEVVRRLQTDTDSESVGLLDKLEYIGGFTADIGRWHEAAAMKKEVLEKRQRILGDEHPNMILAINNLASTLGDQGKFEEAALMFKEVLEKTQRILGDEHPSTILAMHNLAITLGNQGKFEEAAAMKKEVLKKRQWILGDEHPDTISAMHNLANTLRDQGKLKEAAAMKKEVLEKRQRILGDEHPDTISAIYNLANTLRD